MEPCSYCGEDPGPDPAYCDHCRRPIPASGVERDDGSAAAWRARAEELYRRADHRDPAESTLLEALTAANRAVRLDHASADAWYVRGLVLAAMRRPIDAATSFDAALVRDPDLSDARVRRDRCLAALVVPEGYPGTCPGRSDVPAFAPASVPEEFSAIEVVAFALLLLGFVVAVVLLSSFPDPP